MYKENSGETTIQLMFTPCLGYLAPYKNVKAEEIIQNQNVQASASFYVLSGIIILEPPPGLMFTAINKCSQHFSTQSFLLTT